MAIVAVLFAHFAEPLEWIGNFGVQLFFVLSGYLMGGLLFIKEVPFKDFFARRFSRVLPAFFLFIGVMAVYAALFQPEPYAVPASELISTLLFVRSYFPTDISINSGDWPIGHVWSLNVEEHSYVLLAAGAFVARSLGRKTVALVFLWLSVAAAICFTLVYPEYPPGGATPWHRRSEAAALGLLASAAWHVSAQHTSLHWFRTTSPRLALAALGMAVISYTLAEFWDSGPDALLQYTITPLLLACSVNALTRAPAFFHRMLSVRALRWFGTCSFSLYLWQQPFYYAHNEYGLHLLPALGGALACGALSFYYWENPLRHYFNNKWAESRRRNGGASAENGKDAMSATASVQSAYKK